MINKADRSSYTALDFRQWKETDALVLSPKFQRRGVWTTPQKSYLIDTILRGLPVPPIYLRIRQSDDKKKTIREVIDGQQRITAVLEFINNEYKLSRSLDGAYAGKSYSQLSEDQQNNVTGYAFICESFGGINDAEILEIFSRLNTNAVALNGQELRNGRFFGLFKQSVYTLAHEHVEFWRSNKILPEQGIARMADAELVSELLAAQLKGMGDKKRSLDPIYKEFDEKFPSRKDEEKRFRQTIDSIVDALGDSLRDTVFHRRALFYSLYCAVFHRTHGIPGTAPKSTPSNKLTTPQKHRLKDTVLYLSDVVEEEVSDASLAAFLTASQRQTDNLQPRLIRFRTIYQLSFE